ncbi:MAG TPA: hypothetical protein VK190_03565 [Pseudoneobacillus sp.]|nr:hypothetical protein [Pseudoneobacillus sp.]
MQTTHEGNLNGEEMFPLLKRISPDRLTDGKYEFIKQETEDRIEYIMKGTSNYNRIILFTITKGRYDLPVDEGSEVYMQYTLFFSSKSNWGTHTDYRGAITRLYKDITGFKMTNSWLRDIDDAIVYINKHFDDNVVSELSPILFAAKLMSVTETLPFK